MAKQNLAFFYGRVAKAPNVSQNLETGKYGYAMAYLDTVRSLREVDDKVRFVKHDHPLITSLEPAIIEKMVEWKENDIVIVKGVVTSKRAPKGSICPYCKDEKGVSTRNESDGNILYVTPIHVQTIKSYGEDKLAAIEDIISNREISNQVYIYGTLLRDPKFYVTKQGVSITQYPIAINRKFTIRTDDPSIKTDYPFVKSYGEQARQDKTYLRYQAEIIADGFLQARRVKRKCTCKVCGKAYDWEDRMMEIVPYAVEYVSGQRTDEEVEQEFEHKVEEYKQMLFSKAVQNDILEPELQSSDIQGE